MPYDPDPTPDFDKQCRDILDLWESGDLSFREASGQLDSLRSQAAEANHPANQGRAELLLGVMQGYRANLDTAIAHFERARSLFEQAGNRRRTIGAILNLGESYRLKGSFARARQLFRAAYDAAEALSAVDTQALAAFNEGQMLISMEQPDSARRSIETARQLIEQMIDSPQRQQELRCEVEVALAQVYLLMKDTGRAWDHARAGLHHALRIDQPLQVGVAQRTVGEVLSALLDSPPDDPDISNDPDEHFHASMTAFQEIKAEGELARTMYSHALSLAKRGRGMSGARKMQQAMIIFTRLGMNDDAAKAARAQIDVLAKATSSMEPVRDTGTHKQLPSADTADDQPASSAP